jgi:hypothetical protein
LIAKTKRKTRANFRYQLFPIPHSNNLILGDVKKTNDIKTANSTKRRSLGESWYMSSKNPRNIIRQVPTKTMNKKFISALETKGTPLFGDIGRSNFEEKNIV